MGNSCENNLLNKELKSILIEIEFNERKRDKFLDIAINRQTRFLGIVQSRL